MPAALRGPGAALALLIAAGVLATAWSQPLVTQAADGARTFAAENTMQLQAALAEALPGDTIALRPDVVYRGPFVLRNHGVSGDESRWITITGTDPPPPAGERVRPRTARRLPRLIASHEAVVVAEPGASQYRLVGLEISPAPGQFLFNVIDLGSDNDSLARVPHHIRIEQCWVHGDPERGSRRGLALNGAHIDVVDSYFSDFKERGNDSQAIAGWNGPGPFLIENNYLEAAAENVLFGGADPLIPELVPADIVIRRNQFSKPLSWREEQAAFGGERWLVKNLLELKNARRVVIEYNLFEHTWVHGQDGFAILFTVRNQDGGAPWSVVEDVRFERNIVRRAGAGVLILGRDDNHESQQTNTLSIRHNLFAEIGQPWGDGRLFLLQDGVRDATIEHNTALHESSFLLAGDARPHPGFVFQHNIVMHNEYGAIGGNHGPGRSSLDHYFPDAVFRGNVIVGGPGQLYPGDNFFPGRVQDVGFMSAGDFRLASGSRFKGRAGGDRDPGFDGEALKALPAGRAVPRRGGIRRP